MREGGSKTAVPGVGMDLRRSGSILLVSCYELGHQPLGLASPLGFLETAGFEPAALDLAVEEIDSAELARAGFVGVSVPMYTALRLGVAVAERVRAANPDAHICLYGLYAWLNAEHLLDGVADSVIGGEIEGPLVELVKSLEAGSDGPVEGVVQRGRPAPPHLEKLDFAASSREGLPDLTRYAQLERDGAFSLAGHVEASRGCLHGCLHCPIPPVYEGRLFVVPREVVLEDIRRQVRAGARHVSFGDPDFLNGPTHSLRIVREMHAEHPEISFDFTAKVEHLVRDARLLPELAECGCVFVVSAVESLSDQVLANLEKGHTRAEVDEALHACKAAGVALRPSLLSFTPWTSLDDYLDVLDWVKREDLIDHVDPVHYSIRLLVPPGSALLDRDAIGPHLDGLDQAAFSWRWRHPDPRMDALHQAVSAVVEAAVTDREDARLTFERIQSLAHEAAGRPEPEAAPPVDGERARPPRLTESWFC